MLRDLAAALPTGPDLTWLGDLYAQTLAEPSRRGRRRRRGNWQTPPPLASRLAELTLPRDDGLPVLDPAAALLHQVAADLFQALLLSGGPPISARTVWPCLGQSHTCSTRTQTLL